ncbi:MAG: response regulator [Vicinamibacterales bacterium]
MTKTVLLADDSTTIQRVVELALAGRDDVRVVSVGDGEEAIARIRQSPPDLVLADIAMPYRSGYDVAEWVREQAQPGPVPVLLLSGAFEPVDQERARSVGAAGIITKPIDPAVLLARVADLLSRDSGAPVAEAPESLAPEPVPPTPDLSAPASEPDAPPPHVPVSPADQYFDDIDRAFATLKSAPRPPLPPAQEPDTLADWLPGAVAAPPAGSALQDAFATLLDAERTGAVVLPLGRIALAPPAPAAPALDVNALADQIARRVLQQLSERIVRETVTDIVSSTTERLVRDEIERIKRHIT